MRRLFAIVVLSACSYACLGARGPLVMRAVPTEQFPVSWYGEETGRVSTTTTSTAPLSR